MAPLREEPKPGIRVLLVDDEAGYTDVLANRLRKRGLAVSKAYSGGEALRRMRGEVFDVAVVDLKMPDMDGIELLRILKMMDPALQVIMLTGHGSASACREGMSLGAYDYLTKPCELEELLDKIRAASEKAAAPPAGGTPAGRG